MRLLLLLLKKGTLHEAIGFLMSPPLPKVNPAGGNEDPLAPPQKGSPASSSKIPVCPLCLGILQYTKPGIQSCVQMLNTFIEECVGILQVQKHVYQHICVPTYVYAVG